MTTTASSANVLPFPQSSQPQDSFARVEVSGNSNNIPSNNGVYNNYNYNNNRARARIEAFAPEPPPQPSPESQQTPAQIKTRHEREKAAQQAYIAKVQEEYWLSSTGNDIPKIYSDVMGRPMPAIVRSEIAAMIAAGVDKTLISSVLEYTADAPRPSWAYARVVIRRNVAKGVNSSTAFLDSIGRLYADPPGEV